MVSNVYYSNLKDILSSTQFPKGKKRDSFNIIYVPTSSAKMQPLIISHMQSPSIIKILNILCSLHYEEDNKMEIYRLC